VNFEKMRHDVRSRLIVGFLAAATLSGIHDAPSRVAAASASEAQCIVPEGLLRLDVPLERTARRLASSELVVIVALGSSSMAGAGASSDAASYPSRLAIELTRRFPSQPLKVVNHGVNGELAVDMLARFDKSVAGSCSLAARHQRYSARPRSLAFQLFDPRRHQADESDRRRRDPH
jgi:acyl-CoA thioesterase I